MGYLFSGGTVEARDVFALSGHVSVSIQPFHAETTFCAEVPDRDRPFYRRSLRVLYPLPSSILRDR